MENENIKKDINETKVKHLPYYICDGCPYWSEDKNKCMDDRTDEKCT